METAGCASSSSGYSEEWNKQQVWEKRPLGRSRWAPSTCCSSKNRFEKREILWSVFKCEFTAVIYWTVRCNEKACWCTDLRMFSSLLLHSLALLRSLNLRTQWVLIPTTGAYHLSIMLEWDSAEVVCYGYLGHFPARPPEDNFEWTALWLYVSFPPQLLTSFIYQSLT